MKLRSSIPPECPKSSEPVHGEIEVLRLVEGPNVSLEDFKSWFELHGYERSAKCRCMNYGLSVWGIQCDLNRLRDLWKYPQLREKTSIARIRLTPASGLLDSIKQAKDGHACFWLGENFDPVRATIGVEDL